MDIQKEREAFLHEFEKTEQYRQQYGFYKIPLKYDEQKETWNFYDVQAAWEMWQAAKAVPDLSELQERIAGHQYYHDEHGHMIVDMGDVVKEISGFDSWNAQAVPEGFVLVPTSLSDKQYNQLEEVMQDNFGTTVSQSRDCIIKIHDELVAIAQEPAND